MTVSPLREALATLAGTVERLSELSRRHYLNPYETVEWPQRLRPDEAWFTSPELVSLHGTPHWDGLDEEARRRLAFFEAVNFYSLNIHGESALMAGLAERLYRSDLSGVSEYLHHFLDEENKHSVYFGGFCRRYAQVYRSRQIAFPGSPFNGEQDDFLFFAKTMIFEEIVDYYNKAQGRDTRLHGLARFINHNHHVEEARHLVFGRQLVTRLWEFCAPDWGPDGRQAIRDHLAQFFVMAWREYYNPDVYADCGLPDPWGIAEDAWSSAVQRAHRRLVSRHCLEILQEADVLVKEPSDAF